MTLDDLLRMDIDTLPPLARALCLAERGDWQAAHALAQEDATMAGSLLHAHLHREEGDLANADHWYGRARRSRPSVSIAEERRTLALACMPVSRRDG